MLMKTNVEFRQESQNRQTTACGNEKPSDDVSDGLPPSDLLASLINDIHGLSEIKCEGRTRTRAVIIERFGDTFRLKKTTYRYFHSLDDALAAIRTEHIRIRKF